MRLTRSQSKLTGSKIKNGLVKSRSGSKSKTFSEIEPEESLGQYKGQQTFGFNNNNRKTDTTI